MDNTVNISLVDENSIFTIPGYNFSLHFKNLGPVKIDTSTLDDFSFETLRIAVDSKIISVDRELEPRNKAQAVLNQTEGETEENMRDESDSVEANPEKDVILEHAKKYKKKKDELQNILRGNAKSVKDAILEMSDTQELQYMLYSERRGKKRKTVIELLLSIVEKKNSAIIEEANKVVNHGEEEKETKDPKVLEALSEIEEEEGREVEIQFTPNQRVII